MIETVKRVVAVVTMLALIAEPGSCGKQSSSGLDKRKPEVPAVGAPGAPMKVFPCQHSPQALIVQLYTFQPEPLQFRLSAFDAEGKPLIGNQGEPMANHQDTIVTRFPDGELTHAVYELPLCYKTQVSGYVKVDGGKTVKLGVRFFVLLPNMQRDEIPQSQHGQGRVSVSFVWPFK